MIAQGVYSGIITARSSEEPGRDHVYTVDINHPGGVVTFEGAAPQKHLRWSELDPTLDLIPFPLGTLVTVHVQGHGAAVRAILETSELPNAGPCESGGEEEEGD